MKTIIRHFDWGYKIIRLRFFNSLFFNEIEMCFSVKKYLEKLHRVANNLTNLIRKHLSAHDDVKTGADSQNS